MSLVLSYLFAFIVLFLVILGIMWGRIKSDRNWYLIEYNRFSKIISVVFSLPAFYFTYSAFSAHFSGKGPYIAVLIILVIYSVICILWMNETYRAKAWFDNENIYFQSPYGRKITMNFNDIESCKLSRFEYYVIISKSGKKIRLNSYMPGVINFIEFIEIYRINGQ
ncbi:membrane protein [Beggiatoa sp. PS]|nr:membrane protein [Beggiatoa sp. PS]